MVTRHQTIRITTITVVICMMRSAFSLDSWMPMMFLRQKYSVTTDRESRREIWRVDVQAGDAQIARRFH